MEMMKVPKLRDFDTDAYIEPLMHEWLEHVHKDNAKQLKVFKDGTEFNIPYMAVPFPVIKTIFVITGHFGLGPNTTYLAIHLFDKFMCNHFCELYLTESGADPDEDSWSQISRSVSDQSKLRIMSCIQLASKMDSHSKGLGISQVMRMLRWLDDKSEYTRSVIYSSEFYVYKTVDFKIPLFTPLHCVEILLAVTKLGKRTPQIYDVCVNLLDLAYLQHDRIYSQLQFLIKNRFSELQIDPRSNIMALESNMLYLGAAVVLCSIFILTSEDSDAKHVVQALSHLVGIRESNIQLMADLLFATAVQEDHGDP